jgi:hypothetical protein
MQMKEQGNDDDEKKSDDAQKEMLEDMINQGFKALKLKRNIKDVESINPLTMRIEDIFNFPDDIPVSSRKVDEITLSVKTEEM